MSDRTGSVTIRAYCTCGAKIEASSTPPDAAEQAHHLWRSLHCGEGHGPATPEQARSARRRADGAA